MPENIKIISQENASGSVSLKYGSTLKVRLKLTLSQPLAETDVLKVLLTSSVNRQRQPLYCGIAETDGVDCVFSKSFDEDKDYVGIDTVEIILKNVFTEETMPFLKVCFNDDIIEEKQDGENEEDREEQIDYELEKLRQQLDALQSNSAYKSFIAISEDIKSPVERAADVLNTYRNMRSANKNTGANKLYMNRISETAAKFEKCNCTLPDDFIWYKITDSRADFCASAIDHVISYPETSGCIGRFGYYMLGIKEAEDTVCLAIPTEVNNPNPMANVDDCTVYIKPDSSDFEYCCVCILFAPDGQYFTPIC